MNTHMMTKRLLTLFTCSLLILSIIRAASATEEAQSTPEPMPFAEDFTIKTLSGTPFTLSDYKDQSVMIVFWATWCPYCKKLLPGIERLHQKYGAKGLKVIAITIMEDGDPKAYVEQYGYTFDVGLDGDHLMNKFFVPGTPTIAVITKNNQWHAHLRNSDPNSIELENAVRGSLGLEPLPISKDNNSDK